MKFRSPVRFASLAGLTVLVFVTAGCVFDPVVTRCTYSCSGAVYRYARSTPSSPPWGATQKGATDSLAYVALRLGTPLYADKGWKPMSIPGPLKGAYVLQIPWKARTNTASLSDEQDWFIRFDYRGKSVDRLWIAVDERASQAPAWLRHEFEPVEPAVVLDSTEPSFVNGHASRTRYRLWKPKAGFAQYIEGCESPGRKLGGNNGSGVSWRGGAVGSQYLVLIRMRPAPDTSSKIRKIGDAKVEYQSVCESPAPIDWLMRQASALAMAKWLAKPGHGKYRQAYEAGLIGLEFSTSSCSEVTSGTGSSAKPLRAAVSEEGPELLGSWIRSSEGTLDPAASTITVTVSGHASQTAHVTGRIDFAIEDGNTATIENIDLWGEDLVLDDGTAITGLGVSQRHAFTALCSDGLPHAAGRLCTRYEVPVDPEYGFLGGAVVTVDGHDLALSLENTQPVTLEVDPDTMSFRFTGGPVTGTFEAGGTTWTAQIALDLEGSFDNLAPVADVSETSLVWECGDGGLADGILSASASTDELDPSDITGFDWYEDEGALTENHLGSGSSLAVSMPLGQHDLTLEVSDAHGTTGSTDFVLDVVDSRIDSIQLPPDRWVLVTDPSGTPVETGTASASDLCSNTVEIGNDLPADGRFPKGFTPVTWTFDDTDGNLVIHTQRIFVLAPAFFPPPVSSVEVTPAEAGTAQPVTIVHRTAPQGRGMLLDEYVLIRNAAGGLWSIDASGAVVPGIALHAGRLNRGAAPTADTVFSGTLGTFLDGPGTYTVETVLVEPGGSPEDRSAIVAWSRAAFELVP